MIRTAFLYAVEFSLRYQQNKTVMSSQNHVQENTQSWLVQELLREKKRTGRNGDEGREALLG